MQQDRYENSYYHKGHYSGYCIFFMITGAYLIYNYIKCIFNEGFGFEYFGGKSDDTLPADTPFGVGDKLVNGDFTLLLEADGVLKIMDKDGISTW